MMHREERIYLAWEGLCRRAAGAVSAEDRVQFYADRNRHGAFVSPERQHRATTRIAAIVRASARDRALSDA